ncbi:MAG: hypothetical protein ABFC77_03620 [Thermoguttaceae bacterium]
MAKFGCLPRFPVVVGLLAIAVVWGHRRYCDAPLGPCLSADSHRALSGWLSNPADNMSYSAWAEQAKRGDWLFSDLFTTDPHAQVYFNPYFQLVGHCAQWFHIESIAVMHLLAIASALLAAVLVYDVSRSLGWSTLAARTSCLLVMFSSGWTAWFAMTGAKFEGADFGYGDLFACNNFATGPYQAFAALVQMLLVWSLIRAEQACDAKSSSRIGLLTLVAVAAAATTTVRPYGIVLPLVSYVAYVFLSVWSAVGNEPLAWRPRFQVMTALAFGALPTLAYTDWLTHLPVWHYFAAQSLANPKLALFWTIGFGSTLFLSLWGIHLIARNLRRVPPASWLALWVCMAVGGFIFFELRCTTKLLEGAFVAMSLLAGLAVQEIVQDIRQLRPQWMRAASYFLLTAFALSGVPSYFLYLHSFQNRADHYDPEIVEATAALAEQPDVALLTDAITGNRLPGLRGVRVWAGHWSLTPKYRDKARQLEEAGISAGVGTEDDPIWICLKDAVFTQAQRAAPHDVDRMKSKLLDLLTTSQCGYLLVNRRTPAYRLAKDSLLLPVVKETDRWTLFRADFLSRLQHPPVHQANLSDNKSPR